MVADARYLQIQRSTDRFSGEKFRAFAVAVCHEVDLALLAIEDESVTKEIAKLPKRFTQSGLQRRPRNSLARSPPRNFLFRGAEAVRLPCEASGEEGGAESGNVRGVRQSRQEARRFGSCSLVCPHSEKRVAACGG